MRKKVDFRPWQIVSLGMLALSYLATYISDLAANKEQDAIIDEKVNKALAEKTKEES